MEELDKGVFITFEGIEGCGKSTQAKMLYEHLIEEGCGVLATREPGSTNIGCIIRETLLTTKYAEMDPRTELLLFAACRAQHVQELVKPALAAGKTVVCDRYTDSTLAYQAYGRGLPFVEVERISDWAAAGVVPDLTFLLDLPVETALKRIAKDQLDRIERADRAFHERVRDGFLALAGMYPERFRVLDAAKEPMGIHRDISAVIDKLI